MPKAGGRKVTGTQWLLLMLGSSMKGAGGHREICCSLDLLGGSWLNLLGPHVIIHEFYPFELALASWFIYSYFPGTAIWFLGLYQTCHKQGRRIKSRSQIQASSLSAPINMMFHRLSQSPLICHLPENLSRWVLAAVLGGTHLVSVCGSNHSNEARKLIPNVWVVCFPNRKKN